MEIVRDGFGLGRAIRFQLTVLADDQRPTTNGFPRAHPLRLCHIRRQHLQSVALRIFHNRRRIKSHRLIAEQGEGLCFRSEFVKSA